MRLRRSSICRFRWLRLFRRSSQVATALVVTVSVGLLGCNREGQAEVEEKLDEVGERLEREWEKAEPEIREGVREAGEAVGKGLEAAGELIQKGGEELQEEARDTTESTLPDTAGSDTVVLE